MVMRLFRIVVVSLAVVLLGSCNVLQYIFGSVFPTTMTLIKAQADLSGKIASGSGGSYNVRVVEAGSNGYVVVAGSVNGSAPQMFIYDLDLKLKLALTGATAPAGTGIMADGTGQIRAGGTLYNSALLSPVVGGPVINGSFSSGDDGFNLYSPVGSNAANFTMTSPSTLGFTHYNPDWTTDDTHSYALSAGTNSYQLDAVLDDGNPAGSVIFVLSQSQSGGGNGDTATRWFVTITKTDMVKVTVPPYPLDSAPHRDNLTRESIGFADGSIFAYDSKENSVVRINPADVSTKDSLAVSSNNKGQLKYAYPHSGGTFYTFDTNSLILTKYVAWW